MALKDPSTGRERRDIINVLTVDDEPSQLELLKFYLERFDPAIHVEGVTTPAETLYKLRVNAYDCIVADHKMPGMTGIELAQRVKGDTRIPFILYTGRGSEEVASSAFDAEIDDYVRKDPDPEHYKNLAKRIRRAVERYRSEARRKTQKEIVLPEYPKVEIRGKDFVVIWEDGREELWGSESVNMSRGSEEGVELGLKSIKYVKSKLAESIDEIVGDLLDVGIPPKYLDRIVNEGYDGIKKLLIKLYYNKIDLEQDD